MSLTREEIFDGLAEIIEDETGIPAKSIRLEMCLTHDPTIDSLDIDSISMMTIVVNAEEKFGVKIPDEEVKNLHTVEDAVEIIYKASQEESQSD